MFSYPKSPIFWELVTKVRKSHQMSNNDVGHIFFCLNSIKQYLDKGHIFLLLYLNWATFWQGTFFFFDLVNMWDIFFFVVPQLSNIWKRDIFFFCCTSIEQYLEKGHIFFLVYLNWATFGKGTYFFFDVVHMWDIFFEALNCKSASRTLRSLRSLRATAGLRPAVACASLGKHNVCGMSK